MSSCKLFLLIKSSKPDQSVQRSSHPANFAASPMSFDLLRRGAEIIVKILHRASKCRFAVRTNPFFHLPNLRVIRKVIARAFKMLTTLRIKNLAIVADLTLELQPGCNVITGETGAG